VTHVSLGETRPVLVAGAGAGLIVAYAAATVAGAPDTALTVLFSAVVAMVAPLAWWAFARIPVEFRRLCGVLAVGATLWLAGTLVWLFYFLTGGQEPPGVLGPWDVIFGFAYLLGITALIVELRPAISVRHAALDASVILAAGLAFGSALVGPELEGGINADTVGTLLRPTLGILMLTLVLSAALGRWDGIPVSVVLVGGAQVFLAVGGLVYSYDVIQEGVANFRWAGLALSVGAAFSMGAATVIVLGRDRPLRVGTQARIPHHPLGAKGVLYLALSAIAVTVGVAFYGNATENEGVLTAGLAASVWVGAAMALRARLSIRELEGAYADLERAHLALERANDELAEANQDLAGANVQIRAMHAAFEDLLVIVDERTDGALGELIEEAGEDLADFLGRYRRGET
jgi:hypothetical protein